jgi:hypothetical protein
MRRLSVLLVASGLLLVVPADAATVKLKLTTSSASPIVGQPWRYTITARTRSGTAAPARAKLQLLLGETIVGCWRGGAMVQCFAKTAGDWRAFRGKLTGVLHFPAHSVGVRLTFQALVTAAGQTRKLRAPVTVRPASAPAPLPTGP